MDNNDLLKEFDLLLEKYQKIDLEYKNNKIYSDLFLIYSDLFNICPSVIIAIKAQEADRCLNRINFNDKVFFKEASSNKKIICTPLNDQSFLHSNSVKSKIENGKLFISSKINKDEISNNYILSFNNKYKNSDLFNIAIILHNIKYGCLVVSNNKKTQKTYKVKISILGLDFDNLNFSKLFLIKLILNASDILNFLKIEILDLHETTTFNNSLIEYIFDLNTYDYDDKFLDFCDFNNVFLLNYFTDNIEPITFKLYQSNYEIKTANNQSLINPRLYNFHGLYLYKNQTNKSLYSKSFFKENLTIDDRKNTKDSYWEFDYPNKISFEFNLGHDIDNYKNIKVFGEAFWQQDLSNIKFDRQIYMFSNNKPCFSISSLCINASYNDSKIIYNRLLKILNISDKVRLVQEDIKFLLDFFIKNDKSIFYKLKKFINKIDIELVDGNYHMILFLSEYSKDYHCLLGFFTKLLEKLFSVVLPFFYKYNIEVKYK
tara:strand:+ start:20995 stop:22455 length:1461 start_codon:yes stop_codon:yes gene_type:complete